MEANLINSCSVILSGPMQWHYCWYKYVEKCLLNNTPNQNLFLWSILVIKNVNFLYL